MGIWMWVVGCTVVASVVPPVPPEGSSDTDSQPTPSTSGTGETGETGLPSAPHQCLGAMLYAVWDDELDDESLVDAVEAALPELSCWANPHGRFLECTPADDACAWTVEKATEAAPAFLDALVSVDPAFEDYPYAVVDECACRAFR